jgi:hypothetical protein
MQRFVTTGTGVVNASAGSTVEANRIKGSMLLEVDQAFREDTHLLPKRVRKLIEQLAVASRKTN